MTYGEAKKEIYRTMRADLPVEIKDDEIRCDITYEFICREDAYPEEECLSEKDVEVISERLSRNILEVREDDGYEDFMIDCFKAHEDQFYISLSAFSVKEREIKKVSDMDDGEKIGASNFLLVDSVDAANQIYDILIPTVEDAYIEGDGIPRSLFGVKIPDDIMMNVFKREDVTLPFIHSRGICGAYHRFAPKENRGMGLEITKEG